MQLAASRPTQSCVTALEGHTSCMGAAVAMPAAAAAPVAVATTMPARGERIERVGATK
jgi:hypothetical protein